MLLPMLVGVGIVAARETVVKAGRKTVISRSLDFKWESDASQIGVLERLFWQPHEREIGGAQSRKETSKVGNDEVTGMAQGDKYEKQECEHSA